MIKSLFITSLFIISFFAINSQTRNYTTESIDGKTIKIDGTIETNEWGTDNWVGDFVQYEPMNGNKPSQNTEFKLYLCGFQII
jgi:hypothetical protein